MSTVWLLEFTTEQKCRLKIVTHFINNPKLLEYPYMIFEKLPSNL